MQRHSCPASRTSSRNLRPGPRRPVWRRVLPVAEPLLVPPRPPGQARCRCSCRSPRPIRGRPASGSTSARSDRDVVDLPPPRRVAPWGVAEAHLDRRRPPHAKGRSSAGSDRGRCRSGESIAASRSPPPFTAHSTVAALVRHARSSRCGRTMRGWVSPLRSPRRRDERGVLELAGVGVIAVDDGESAAAAGQIAPRARVVEAPAGRGPTSRRATNRPALSGRRTSRSSPARSCTRIRRRHTRRRSPDRTRRRRPGFGRASRLLVACS